MDSTGEQTNSSFHNAKGEMVFKIKYFFAI